MLRLERRHAAFEDAQAELFFQRRNLDDKSAGQARAHTLFQGLKFGRRAVGGDDNWRPASMSAFKVWQIPAGRFFPARIASRRSRVHRCRARPL